MPAYMFANVEVTMPRATSSTGSRYRRRSKRTAAVPGAVGRRSAGDWVPKRMVILEFADMAQLKAWYHSPEYRPLIELRQRTATSTLVAVEDFSTRKQ